MGFHKVLIIVDQAEVVADIPVAQPAAHGFHQVRVGGFAVGIPAEGFFGVVFRGVFMLLGLMKLDFCQKFINLVVFRLPFPLFQQKYPLGFYLGGVKVTHIPNHILDPVHPGLIGEGEKLVYGDAKIGRELRQHTDVRRGRSPLPFANGLGCDAEMLGHGLLGDTPAEPQLFDLISDFHCNFLLSFGPVDTMITGFPGKNNGGVF